jgi:general secretion pathway protein C
LPGQSISKFTHALERGYAAVGDLFVVLAQPARVRRLRQLVIGLALIWLLVACARLVWAFFPVDQTALPADVVILNPAEAATKNHQAKPVDINAMLSWHLLGKADEAAANSVISESQPAQATGREGIEEGASETRLDLRLRGIIASTVDGLGHAIIEYKSKQQVYTVEDKLPVSGRVILAKVMADRVVIDNRGTYELLVLFEESELSTQVPAVREPPPARPASLGGVRAIDKRSDAQTTALAQNYRQKLYQNPQALADLVRISAVREEGVLLGYKVAPGTDRKQFAQLGFKTGDLITSVNGIALTDPANTVRLYQLMRSAGEAVFDLQRDNEQFTVTVSLDDTGSEQ